MSLSLKDKIALQKEASEIKKSLNSGELSIGDKIEKQKRWSFIIKRLNGRIDDNGNDITEAANQAATGDNDLPEPTDNQKQAGNYKKGDITLSGINFRIENPKGSTRSGKDKDGNKWSITMKHHYGDVKGSKGADDDPIDVFIGDTPDPEKVFIIDQVDLRGQFDEHKVMFGFDSMADAKKAYLANYEDGWAGLGDITAMPLEKFKKWVSGGKRTQPVGAISDSETTFLDEYQGGKFNDLKPDAFKGLILQADEEGLSLEENKAVVTAYILSNQKLFEVSASV